MENTICSWNNSYRSATDRQQQSLYCPLAQSQLTGPSAATNGSYRENYAGIMPCNSRADFPLKNAYSNLAGSVYFNSNLAPGYEGYRNRDSKGTIVNESYCPSCSRGGLGSSRVSQGMTTKPGV